MDADTFVLTLPMSQQREALTLFAFIGGLSAGTGMVIVETIALSTMVCNDLVMPVLLRMKSLRLNERQDLSGLLLVDPPRSRSSRSCSSATSTSALVGEAYALVAIGLISFAAVAQFAPAILGGIYWKGATRAGALAGLTAGFAVWVYTLLAALLRQVGLAAQRASSPTACFGVALLKPQQLFGLTGLDEITHALFWSMLANIGLYVGVSLASAAGASRRPARRRCSSTSSSTRTRSIARGSGAAAPRCRISCRSPGRFLGPERAREAFLAYARRRGVDSLDELPRRRGSGPLRGDAARRRHRGRLRARHGRLGRCRRSRPGSTR